MRGAKRQRLTLSVSRLEVAAVHHSTPLADHTGRSVIQPPAALDQAAPRGPVVVIDNYDSFTYNLCQASFNLVMARLLECKLQGCVTSSWVHAQLGCFKMQYEAGDLVVCVLQYLGSLGCDHVVFKNDEKTVEEIRAMNPLGVLLSPGPGKPGSWHPCCCMLVQTCRDLAALMMQAWS